MNLGGVVVQGQAHGSLEEVCKLFGVRVCVPACVGMYVCVCLHTCYL